MLEGATTQVPEPSPNYRALDLDTVVSYLADRPKAAEVLGGRPEQWRAQEVGDGNLNMVFIVEGPSGDLVVKQALPYVRLVGDSWPLPASRAFFEHQALVRQAQHVPDLVPQVYDHDHDLALIVMERLSPHLILRKGLIRGIEYPRIADDLGRFLAEMLFKTSELHIRAPDKKPDASLFQYNIQIIKITEDLVFTDPYRAHELNRWTSPQLDETVAEIRRDGAWKVAVQELKWAFLTRGEALIHGDLHTGSVMATPEDTRVIDAEFAFYGPMGFDIGAILANFLIAYFAQSGHEESSGARDGYRDWLLQPVTQIWDRFETRFRQLWREARTGDAYPTTLYEDQDQAEARERALDAFVTRLRRDALGFAGAKMTRRILGLAHVEDFEAIADPDLRARCERQALRLARTLIVETRSLDSVAAATQTARSIYNDGR